MEESGKTYIKKLTWDDIRKVVTQINPEVANIIDSLSPSSKYTLYAIDYPFGSEIVKKGCLYLPSEGGILVPLTSSQISDTVREDLNYNFGSNPVTLILEKSVELFVMTEGQNAPLLYGLIPAGAIISTSIILSRGISQHPAFIWDLTAGTRSIFMLAKISKMAGFRRLKRAFHLQSDKPNKLIDHWDIFKELANQQAFGERWSTKLLAFSKKWFDHLDDTAWDKFHLYLLKSARHATEFSRNEFIWGLVFSFIQRYKHIKPNPYISDTVKHLLKIGVGAIPGMAPAIDEMGAPIRRLQEIFLDIYGLEDYGPIIMQPAYFNLYNDTRPVYYSLQYPNLLEFSPKGRENPSAIQELCEVRSLLAKYLEEICSGILNLDGIPLYDLTEKVKFNFFHSDSGPYYNINNSTEIPKDDPSFSKLLCSEKQNLRFPFNSSFVRGCVRISRK